MHYHRRVQVYHTQIGKYHTARRKFRHTTPRGKVKMEPKFSANTWPMAVIWLSFGRDQTETPRRSGRCSSLSAFGRLTGNDVSGHQKRPYFLPPPFFFSSVGTFSHRRSARIKRTYLVKSDGSAQKPMGRLLSRPGQPFWILQAVRRCRRWVSAPGAAILKPSTSSLRNIGDGRNRKKQKK